MAPHLIDLDFGSSRIEHMKPFNLESFHLPQFEYDNDERIWACALPAIDNEYGSSYPGDLEWLAISMEPK